MINLRFIESAKHANRGAWVPHGRISSKAPTCGPHTDEYRRKRAKLVGGAHISRERDLPRRERDLVVLEGAPGVLASYSAHFGL